MRAGPAKRIDSRDELLKTLKPRREKGETVVLTNGAYDLLHVGHLRCLRDAASKGNILVVAMNSDPSVRANKGEGHPIYPEPERAELLCGLTCVDYVHVFHEKTVDDLLKALKPDIYAKGTDYTLETLPERDTLLALGIPFQRVGDPKDHSTTMVIQKIIGMHGS